MTTKREREKSHITVPMSTHRYGEAQKAAATLTTAEGAPRKMPDVGRNAIAFYLAEMAKCFSCSSGVECPVHGTAALRPEDAVPDVNPAEHVRLKRAYLESFRVARGEDAVFGGKEAHAISDLIRTLGIERAEAAVVGAFRDHFWRSKATILSIAADPSRHLGTVAASATSTPIPRSSLQPDSGFRGGEPVR